jgi:retron-type reverse transcriptase
MYSKEGAMTKGWTPETVDAMSMKKIHQIIDALRQERSHWTPARRTDVPKKNGGKRPLGLPTFSDKLLQEGIRSLLEASYEPQFSNASHGFREGTRMPHGMKLHPLCLDRLSLVYRRRHQSVFRANRSSDHAIDTCTENL